MRHRAGELELEQLKNRSQETASDQLEAIMGLRDRAAGNWIAAGDCVDRCCSATHEAWTLNSNTDIETLSSTLGLEKRTVQ